MTLAELRARRDVWPIVQARIPEAISEIHQHLDQILNHPDLMDHLERKFRKGEAEHQGAWLRDADPSWLISEAAEEIFDFILYQCMWLIHIEASQDAA
jgi:hypothetical protein